jgi:3-deoxy-D-manno-octulosonic-acid transferase
VARWLLAGVDRFAVQTAEDARRLGALGIEPERVVVTGNLKYEAPEPRVDHQLEASLLALASSRPLLIAGSTMPGEEEAVLAALERLGGGERALLVLAPRHPERWDEVARLLDATGKPWVRRTALAAAVDAAAPRAGFPGVVLLDSLGELAALYRLATACFVGGTLAARGGHNPLEPARFARPIAAGPSMENFREMAAQLDARGAWRRVESAGELAAVWEGWLRDPAAAAAIGERARAVAEENRGALERTLAVLAPLLAAGASTASAAGSAGGTGRAP